MKINFKSSLALVLAVFACMFCSCRKDNNSSITSKKFLGGGITFIGHIPYISPDSDVSVKPKGVYHPEEHKMGLYYYVSTASGDRKLYPLDGKNDTLFHPKTNPLPDNFYKDGTPMYITIPSSIFRDSLGTYKINVTVFPEDSEDYYYTSGAVEITLVNEEKSIPEISVDSLSAGTPIYVDTRGDGPLKNLRYGEISYGGGTWMSRNLAYRTAESSLFFRNCSVMGYVAGIFYNWNTAQTVCPSGWRLPTEAEWKALAVQEKGIGHLLSEGHFNHGKEPLWEFWPGINITNKSQMGIIPSGYCEMETQKFDGFGDYAVFWTSEESSNQGKYVYFYKKVNEISTAYADKNSFGANVRCVRQ